MLSTSKQPYLLTICSGKGGVGKSVIASNLAYQLAANNVKVLLIDADLVFPNLHLLFGIDPILRISDWLFNDIAISRIIFNISENLSLISGSHNTDLNLLDNTSFVDLYHDLLLDTEFDYIIVDTNAGISRHLIESASLSNKIGVVVTDEPTSMIDAYSTIKVLKEFTDNRKMNLILNNVIDKEDANEIIQKFNQITKHFLDMSIDVLGVVPYSDAIRRSIINQELLSITNSENLTVEALKSIATNIITINK